MKMQQELVFVEALFKLGYCYLNCTCVEQNYTKMIECYTKVFEYNKNMKYIEKYAYKRMFGITKKLRLLH